MRGGESSLISLPGSKGSGLSSESGRETGFTSLGDFFSFSDREAGLEVSAWNGAGLRLIALGDEELGMLET